MSIFDNRSAKAMLLTESEPFDSVNHIFELKLDGIRCLAYLDDYTELRNKRNKILNEIYPELNTIHKSVSKKCILDGELVVIVGGVPDFFEVQRRSLMTDKFKIELYSKQKPVMFICYDILFVEDEELLYTPLIERKKILEEIVTENKSIAISRYVEDKGIEYYKVIAAQDLEGVVAKRKDSIYQMGVRSKYWVKFKNLYDSDFVICGYTPSDDGIKSLLLGVYEDNRLVYQSHVSLGISKEEQNIIINTERGNNPFNEVRKDVIWLKPELVCSVKYMMRTKSGSLRQPIYKGLRYDKKPEECTTNQFIKD